MKEADDISGSKRGKRRHSKTDNTNGQQKPWLFKPGQSGNPAGRPKGSRNKLAEDFLSDAYQQWQQHGSTALETMAKTEPAKFCQMVANLLPKEQLMPEEGRVQISEIKLVIIDTANSAPGINSDRLDRPQSGVVPALQNTRVIEHAALEHNEYRD